MKQTFLTGVNGDRDALVDGAAAGKSSARTIVTGPGAVAFLFLACLAPLSAQKVDNRISPVPAATAESNPASEWTLKSGYLLGSGDQIVIRAANAADISEKPIRIDPSGMINMPTIGRVRAGGLTTEALEAELVKRLKVYIEEPEVAVSVTEYRSQPVSILGEVSTPGVHQLQGSKTLIEILAQAGGVKGEAGPSIRITRRLEYGRIPLPGAVDDATGQFSVAELPLTPLINAKTPDKDIVIQPYDIISVPKAELVYIAGEVAKVGTVSLTAAHSISIMEALSSNGGMLKTAAPQKTKILRMVAGSATREQLSVDLTKIMKGQAQDVQLLAGDILFVPGSAAKKASIRALEAAVQAGTVILTYGVVR
jgi:polysaccharide biosynthesis/export protein